MSNLRSKCPALSHSIEGFLRRRQSLLARNGLACRDEFNALICDHMNWDATELSFPADRYPRYFFARGGNECVVYHASQRAAQMFGHPTIIAAIEMVAGHETGRVRHFNVDGMPIAGAREQLIIVRSTASGEIVALTEREYTLEFGWPMPRRDERLE